ncbi:hypothetical protein PIB30_046134 [Stylosanthes scabra]|uniref:BED-type domain-containing protein n=1 Tax=Stylosanthes scabra TaxID=79078 RepID=A0ABU6RGJ8_9FABA|nr:hypothetical protein [Stylosanthes scabra]
MRGRRDDHHWDQVTEEDGELKCKHCNKRFKGGITRIKEHLGTEKGTGNIELCPHSAQFLAMLEPPNEFTSSQVTGDHQPTITACVDCSIGQSDVAGPSNMLKEGGGDEDMLTACFETMNPENDAAGPSNMVMEEGFPLSNGNNSFESCIKEIRELLDELSNQEEQHKDYLQWLEYCGEKRETEEAHDWLKKMEGLKQEANQVIELQDPLKKTDDLISKLSHMTYGMSFRWADQDFREMRDLLRDDNVFFIGVCGMGGVGKTWLATHFKNQIRRNKSFNFENVFWVTVSQDFSILKLQNSIAKRIGVNLDDDDEITDRAEILSSALEKIGRSVLILDDVWNYIDLQKVGIPLRTNGIKLILTSRLHHVFQQMDCPTRNLIQMTPFYGEIEGWELFLLRLGCDGKPTTLSREVENTARSVVKMCENLPLGINVMARLMKGANNDINIWKHKLSKLENSAMPKDMEEEVLKVLKRSYDHLADTTIQSYFLQHALYSDVAAEVFGMNLLDEGLIQSTRSLENILVDGQAILAELGSHSLIYLSSEEYRNHWCMHGLLRDMASDIVKGKFMLRCKKGLKDIPEMQEWAPHLKKVSMMDNSIQQIPEGTSPQCPHLSTLNLSRNMITYIPDCFFYHLKALSLLDLSYNEDLTSLPNSLSTLMCLKSLLLEGCFSLKYVPPLGNLQELSRLVISGTSIKKVPKGLEKLAKLRWLDLSHNTQLECIAWSMIFALTNLQYLNLLRTCITGKAKIVQRMMMSSLEYFLGSFRDAKKFADFVENILNRDGGVKYYDIRFPTPFLLHDPHFLGKETKRVIAGNFKGFELLLPHDLDELIIKFNQERSGDLCGAFSFKAPSSLRKIDVRDCPKVERLCCLCIRCSFCQHLQNLQSLILSDLEILRAIWGEDDEFIGLPNLTQLKIMYCRRIQSLMSAESLGKFPKLESIDVYKCPAMKEIFATGMSEDDPDVTITLPKSFRELKLYGLPKLVGVSVYSSIIVCKSPPTVKVRFCNILRQSHLRYKPSPSASESIIYFTSYND